MSSSITDSDLELIKLGNSLGLDLVSFDKLRASQQDNFVDNIRKKALEKMGNNRDNFLSRNNSFYSGSIDFMVSDEPGGKRFFLLETNGGSHRGLSIITKKQQSLLYNGYLEAIYQAISRNERRDNKVLILIGVPVNDALIHEKVIMIEYFRKTLKSKGYKVKIFNKDNFDINFRAEILFLIADYKQLSTSLSYSANWVKYKGENVNLLIGDGIARRINNEAFTIQLKEDILKIKTIIVNPIFRVTDDKSLTYLASFFCKDILKKYNLKYLLFTKAFDEKDLINKLKYLIKRYRKSFIIKPSGGSGGAGVFPVSKDEKPTNFEKIIRESEKEFFTKFMKDRNPYPYTIQEKAKFSLINWRGGTHTFDLRIYLAQNKERVIPIGGLARISRGNFTVGLDKQEFVVNLSGYDGQIEVERGIGFSESNCKLLNLSEEDFVNMFCIGCVIFAYIVKNHKKIINFSEWDKVID
ncbi:MAG: hypothetical protein KGD65_01130 [Candidatus Lokiarchaeota archaeon]|nr:hypothetical protein [Candidatus Lokiarchaeota archaeon]